MKRATLAVMTAAIALLAPSPSSAAVPRGKAAAAARPDKIPMKRTLSALELPMGERISRLRHQGPQGYENLVGIMFDEKAEMDVRWKAVTAAGRLGGKEARPEIDRALKHEVWYMRNAGLVAARSMDRDIAIQAARSLLSDKALVVRSSAAEALADLGDRSSTDLLWRKLNAPENFKGGQSLFVRIKIAEALARLEKPGREAKFIGLLTDRDEALHAPAIQALERLTKKSVGPVDGQLHERRAAWIKWWKEKRG